MASRNAIRPGGMMKWNDDPLSPGVVSFASTDCREKVVNTVFQSTTVQPELAVRLRSMPKVEIHVHLEGATDADTVWEMSLRNGIPLPAPSLDEWRNFYEFRDFPHFAEIYVTATTCMRTPDDYSAMVRSFLRNQAAQNIRYS